MTTGSFWNVDNPLKPWGYHDDESIIIYPFDWTAWLADSGTSYTSHTAVADDPLEVSASTYANGVVSVTVKTKTLGHPVIGQKYAVTCHIVCANGEEEDQTVYLKIREK
jgi:hypothetical protein